MFSSVLLLIYDRLILLASIFSCSLFPFFFNDTATTEIYTLSLHDALPICHRGRRQQPGLHAHLGAFVLHERSEEHTSELQSHHDIVCRLLLEKKKSNTKTMYHNKKTNKKQKQQIHNRQL